eukprot:scaffold36277_cov117-Isochrysis_galbana.AAC.5
MRLWPSAKASSAPVLGAEPSYSTVPSGAIKRTARYGGGCRRSDIVQAFYFQIFCCCDSGDEGGDTRHKAQGGQWGTGGCAEAPGRRAAALGVTGGTKGEEGKGCALGRLGHGGLRIKGRWAGVKRESRTPKCVLSRIIWAICCVSAPSAACGVGAGTAGAALGTGG